MRTRYEPSCNKRRKDRAQCHPRKEWLTHSDIAKKTPAACTPPATNDGSRRAWTLARRTHPRRRSCPLQTACTSLRFLQTVLSSQGESPMSQSVLVVDD